MEWRVLPTFPNYEVSEFGDIRRCKTTPRFERYLTGKPLLPKLAHGYKQFCLCRNGHSETKSAHRAVAEAFLGPPPFEGAQACHKDGSRTNNHYTNLRWDSCAGNQADKILHGTRAIGERNGLSKLTATDIPQIRRAVRNGETHEAVGSRFGVTSRNVWCIMAGKSWRHVA
jgi:HNH endonuclease/NUMOD4 motif-containing protein